VRPHEHVDGVDLQRPEPAHGVEHHGARRRGRAIRAEALCAQRELSRLRE
jgi:hypothetical protein